MWWWLWWSSSWLSSSVLLPFLLTSFFWFHVLWFSVISCSFTYNICVLNLWTLCNWTFCWRWLNWTKRTLQRHSLRSIVWRKQVKQRFLMYRTIGWTWQPSPRGKSKWWNKSWRPCNHRISGVCVCLQFAQLDTSPTQSVYFDLI